MRCASTRAEPNGERSLTTYGLRSRRIVTLIVESWSAPCRNASRREVAGWPTRGVAPRRLPALRYHDRDITRRASEPPLCSLPAARSGRQQAHRTSYGCEVAELRGSLGKINRSFPRLSRRQAAGPLTANSRPHHSSDCPEADLVGARFGSEADPLRMGYWQLAYLSAAPKQRFCTARRVDNSERRRASLSIGIGFCLLHGGFSGFGGGQMLAASCRLRRAS